MDLDMYKHPTTSENIEKLKTFGYKLIEPVEGELASGLKGVGRLEEPEVIYEIIQNDLKTNSPLSGTKVMVSAGPTYEAIDPVRFIGNHSSGKMGFELALAFANNGAEVDLVLGPSAVEVDHPMIHVTNVTSAEEMHEACTSIFPDSKIGIMSAAVADFTPAEPSAKKIKKDIGIQRIELKPTKDILSELGKIKNDDQILVGFALETDDEVSNAEKKLKTKNLDFIVLNSLKDEGAGFGHSTNKVTIFSSKGEKEDFPLKSKKEVATDILNTIIKYI
jgi:phosphopantothenoylcysteine decarboxylase/phosphopantothenate--cysteine ligase